MNPEELIPLIVPATDAVTAVLSAAGKTATDAPTPCAEYTLGDLVDHFAGTSAAMATLGEGGRLPSENPWGTDTSVANDDWPTVLTGNLERLGAGWSRPAAWEGDRDGGGAEMPAAMLGAIALIEVIAHGWDIAVATGQEFTVPPAVAAGFRACAEQTAEQGRQMGAFGPAPDPGSDDDLAVGLAATGRDVGWRPTP